MNTGSTKSTTFIGYAPILMATIIAAVLLVILARFWYYWSTLI